MPETTRKIQHNYEQRIAAYKHNIEKLSNGETALCFLDHLSAQVFQPQEYQNMPSPVTSSALNKGGFEGYE